MKRTIATIATFATVGLSLIGCSSSDDAATANAPSSTPASTASSATTTLTPTTTTTAAVVAECHAPIPVEDPDVASAVSSVPLPAGASVTTVRISTDSDEPGMIAVAIDTCDPAITNADGLRPIATQYAKALRNSAVAEQIFAVYVASYQVTDNDVVNEHKIKVGDFQQYLWNGKPSEAAELKTWDVVTP